MMDIQLIYTSLTRISDLERTPFDITPLPREAWATGDYVVAQVTNSPITNPFRVEKANGRMAPLLEGDLIVGAFGDRFATLEATGIWSDVQEDGRMHLLSGGGMFGLCTSQSPFLGQPLITLSYRGHACVEGRKRTMQDYVPAVPAVSYHLPSIVIIGSSMSSGKTSTARIIIRLLKRMRLRVIGAKLTGAGRYHDVLSMADAGADPIFDFVDAGLPSTIVPETEYRRACRHLLSRMAVAEADLAVIEAGASPLEPYNGEALFDELGEAVRFIVLCASDPYAAVGITTAFGRRPDLITGIATNTAAGIALINRLCDIPALNVLDPRTWEPLFDLLQDRLGTVLPVAT